MQAIDAVSFLPSRGPVQQPYKGAGPALADVVAGHVDFTIATMPGAIQQVRSSALRALGVSSVTRSPELPDVPTIAETELPGYEYVAWFGVFAPGTTLPQLVARISALLRNAVAGRGEVRIGVVASSLEYTDVPIRRHLNDGPAATLRPGLVQSRHYRDWHA